MLNTVWLTEQPNTPQPCVMLLGGFDGLHVGHKKLTEHAKSFGLPVGAMTIVGGKDGTGLFTAEERRDIFYRAGVQFLFELPFAEIKDITPTAFAALLEEKFSPVAFVCGDDFRFGKMAQGTSETLKQATRVRVETLSLVQKNSEKISSSTVKSLLKDGNVAQANELLGERFFVMGEVIKDRGVGKTIGFPTANIAYPQNKFPLKKGVYETCVCVDGKEYKGITNYGARPTFQNQTDCVETHLVGFSDDLYGRKIKVEFVRRLRDIQAFDGVEKLKEQLKKDLREING